MSWFFIFIGLGLNVGGGMFILDSLFSPFHGALVDFEYAYYELISGVIIFLLGFVFDGIGLARRPKKF